MDLNQLLCRLDRISDFSEGLVQRGGRYNSTVTLGDEVFNTVIAASVGLREYTHNVKMVKVRVSGQDELRLPSGTKLTENMFYNEIDTPPIEPLKHESLKAIVPKNFTRHAVLKEHQAAFYDTDTFNSIQSVAYNVAYTTDENMLVCAPTGAGKTLVAVLCILRELTHYSSMTELKISPFKIVYIAPMKALAAEVVKNLSKRLEPIGISVKEFTGDMHLYAEELGDVDLLVTTPEKWDTVTRRGIGENSCFCSAGLLIVDEAHLLHGDRGPVLEAIVARTFRVTESNGARLRVLGLSATLPNYKEIAKFLHVRPEVGLFYFNWGFRPVPLRQTFIGAKNNPRKKHFEIMDDVCYEKVVHFVKRNQQVLIFVHSRSNTIGTAVNIMKRAEQDSDADVFRPFKNLEYYKGVDLLRTSKLKTLKELYDSGLGFHHAGMLRQDRQIVEQLFAEGLIKVLVSTATLAWGVNLPAHAVIIKGTQMYSPKKSMRVDIDLLDVQQMFGRAGRPQFDSMGEAVIITKQIQLPLYLSLLTWQTPIKSNLSELLADHLNAEIVLGTVKSVTDGVKWLKHTFLYVCMRSRPLSYKVVGCDVEARCAELIMNNAWTLHNANMIIYETVAQTLQPTEIGRIASYAYIQHETIKIISSNIETCINIESIMLLLTKAKEFEQVKERPEEQRELAYLRASECCHCFKSLVSQTGGKIAVLLQSHMSRYELSSTALYLDQVYIVRNAGRILRAVFDIAICKRLGNVAQEVVTFQKCLEHHCWPDDHPICQMKHLDEELYNSMKKRGDSLKKIKSIMKPAIYRRLKERERDKMRVVQQWIKSVPLISTEVNAYRLNPDFARIELSVTPNFAWRKNVNHDMFEPFIAWVENPVSRHIYSHKRFTIRSGQAERNDKIHVQMNVMIKDDEILPGHLMLHVESLYWLGVGQQHKLESSLFKEAQGECSASSVKYERIDLSSLLREKHSSSGDDEDDDNDYDDDDDGSNDFVYDWD